MPSGVYPRPPSPRGTPTHNSWAAMKQRCYYKKHRYYSNYGGRGITVCARWRNSFAAFLADMGIRPKATTLDRKDNSLGYSPINCRWATRKQQQANSRLMHNGKLNRTIAADIRLVRKTHCYSMRALAKIFNVSPGTVCLVLNNKIWRNL